MVFKHQHFHETSAEVEAEFPPGATLEGAVSDALASAGGVDASDVAVIARGSEVTLIGTVQLESEIARAEEVALNVAGVTTVRNELRFNRPM
ncbi:BON domain-containing protein [Neorhizobium galegae]|uniref:BON domain-containing protein n=1 Tax=Neorhizobium galegae TaxID=399 RepID=UPI00210337FB|nr:BON domain-containing protein [Neorhizobium galegae]MCQ1850722.1 BON domain-containing protein [Neorhizobium galegae]